MHVGDIYNLEQCLSFKQEDLLPDIYLEQFSRLKQYTVRLGRSRMAIEYKTSVGCTWGANNLKFGSYLQSTNCGT